MVAVAVAVAALRAGPEQLLNDLKFFGYLFEALVGRDLRVFADAVDGIVQHYRTPTTLKSMRWSPTATDAGRRLR